MWNESFFSYFNSYTLQSTKQQTIPPTLVADDSRGFLVALGDHRAAQPGDGRCHIPLGLAELARQHKLHPLQGVQVHTGGRGDTRLAATKQ